MNGFPTTSAPGQWVLLCYRLPREPSTPRIAVWRKLKRLGVAQLGDGLVALPADARTREQLDWVADEVTEAGGTASRVAGTAGLDAPGARPRAADGARRGRPSTRRSPRPTPPLRAMRRAPSRCVRRLRAELRADRTSGLLSARRAGRGARRTSTALADATTRADRERHEVGDPRRCAHRPGGLCLADPPVHRPRRASSCSSTTRPRCRPRRRRSTCAASSWATRAATARSRRSCAATT